MADLIFSPRATYPSDADYGNLYIAHGDGADGETIDAVRHGNPQSLASLVGKILRIKPDDPDGAGPLTYGTPADNPFVGVANARGEIWAYGFRNPHRFSWDAVSDRLIVTNIGHNDWEEVEMVRKGGNYGWAEREGRHVFDVQTGRGNGRLPGNDATKKYIYPVIVYPHAFDAAYGGFGRAITDGFVYRGHRFPFLQGKFIFGDITGGDLFYADYADMLAADDANPATVAAFRRIALQWDTPLDPDTEPETYGRLYEIVEDAYEHRGGQSGLLPGSGPNLANGRADIRIQVDGRGELLFLSKSDGMIRHITSITAAPEFDLEPASQSVKQGRDAVLRVQAFAEPLPISYRWQRAAPGSSNFANLAESATYVGTSSDTFTVKRATKSENGARFRCVATNSAGSATSASATLTVK